MKIENKIECTKCKGVAYLIKCEKNGKALYICAKCGQLFKKENEHEQPKDFKPGEEDSKAMDNK